MKAIPTLFCGILFRSRLEARWAEFFQRIGVAYQYEIEGFEFDDGSKYLPDFWLPLVHSRGKRDGGVFFEVKHAISTMRERNKANALAWGSGRPVVIACQNPDYPDIEWLEEFVGGEHGWHDSGLTFARCPNCGQCDIGFYASDAPTCSCGKASFELWEPRLTDARIAFSSFQRWEPAA